MAVYPAQKREPDDHYFSIDLYGRERDYLLKVLGKALKTKDRRELIELLNDAPRTEGTKPKGYDWDRAEEKAASRGSSLADFIYDDKGES